jgi:two-component system KDP operon response regulator KdpE
MNSRQGPDSLLVVEDEPEIRSLIADWLEEAGYRVATAPDGLSALREFYQQHPDLVLLDVMMPKMDGWELCRRIREVSDVPIVFLSAREQESDRVRGLTLGADDYITKPFGSSELVARVKAALRRARMPAVGPEKQIYTDGVVTIDHLAHEVHVRGEEVSLSPLEFRLLACLVEHAGQVLSHEQLLDRVWGTEYESIESVKLYIGYVRKKVEREPGNPELIQTVRGVGYRYKKPDSASAPS